MTAVENTSLLDSNWNAAIMFVSNVKMSVALNFSRNLLKKGFINKESFDASWLIRMMKNQNLIGN